MAEYSKFDNEGKKITYRCEIPSPQYLSGDVAISDPLNYRQVNENFHTLEGMTLSGVSYDDGMLKLKRADGKTASVDIIGYSSGAHIIVEDVECVLTKVNANGDFVGEVVAPRGQGEFNFVPSGSVSVLKGSGDGQVVIYAPKGSITTEDGDEVKVNTAEVYMNDFKVGTVFSPERSDIAMRFSGENGIDVSQTGNTIMVSAKEGTVPGLPISDDEKITIMPFIVTGDSGIAGATAGRFVVASGLNMNHAGFKMIGSGGIETVTSGNTVIVNGNFGGITGKVSEQRIAVTNPEGNPEDVSSYLTTDSKGIQFKDSPSVLPRRYDDTPQYTGLHFNSLLSSLKTGAVGKWQGIQVPDIGQVNRNVILEGDGIGIRYDFSGGNDVFTFTNNSTGLPEYYKSDRLSISGNGGSSVNLGNIVYDTRGGNTISGFTISGTNGISVNCTGNTIQVSGKINPQEDYSEVGMRIGQASPSSAVSEVCKFLATSGVGNSFIFRSTPSVFIEPETAQSTHKYTDVKYHALITSIGPEKDGDTGHTIEFKDYDQNTGFPSPDSYDRHLKVIGRDGISVDIDPSASTITLNGSGKNLYLMPKPDDPQIVSFSGSYYYIAPESGITASVEYSEQKRGTILHIGSNSTPPVEQRNVYFSGKERMQSMSGDITIVAENGITGDVQYSESGSTLHIGSNGTPTPTEQRKFYYGAGGRDTEASGDIHFLAGEGIGISGSQAQSGATLTFSAKPSSRAFINDKGVVLISSGDMTPLLISGGKNTSVDITTGVTANVISISFIPPVVEKEEGSSDGKITLSENTVPTISLNASSSEGKETLEKVVLSVPSSSETYSIVVNVDKSMSGRNLNELITSSGYTIDTWIDESGSERENITIPSSFERLTYFVTITNGMAIITRSVTSATARKTV